MKVKDLFKKKEKLNYPNEFCIIDYTAVAKQEGIKNDQNKIIKYYSFDKYGFRKMKKYKYSKGTVYSIREVKRVPIIDKTKMEERFPVFGRILPSELEFNK